MRQTARIISIYTADISGVCSALFELGGMTVIHDASGCNSTYTTHDEPRWYDLDSMVYISALTETEAILGDDDRLIGDIVNTAGELSPRFIAICGSPVAMMIGTDFKAIAKVVGEKTGIPAFSVSTNGMHSYLSGVSRALEAVVKHFAAEMLSGRKISLQISSGQHHWISLSTAAWNPSNGGSPKVDFGLYPVWRWAAIWIISAWQAAHMSILLCHTAVLRLQKCCKNSLVLHMSPVSRLESGLPTFSPVRSEVLQRVGKAACPVRIGEMYQVVNWQLSEKVYPPDRLHVQSRQNPAGRSGYSARWKQRES